MPLEASYEILALNGDRWEVRMVTETHGDAVASAMELVERPDLAGVRIVREVFDHNTGLSHGSVLMEKIKGRGRDNRRIGGR